MLKINLHVGVKVENYQEVDKLLHLSVSILVERLSQKSVNCKFCTTNQNGTHNMVDLSRASSSVWKFWALIFKSSCRMK